VSSVRSLLARRHAWLTSERFAAVLLFLTLALVACLMPAQSDTWWQLRAGEEMWRSGRIMLRDEFTHTVAGQYWPNHEWLTQLLFYGIFTMGGLPLLTAFCAAAVLAAWLLVLNLTQGPAVQRLMLVGGGAAFSTAGWSLRPQVLTLALFAATLWLLVRRRFLWVLPPLFLLWANLHGAVATGGVLVVAAVVASILFAKELRAKTIGLAAACLVATAVTPLGVSLWIEIPGSLNRLQSYNVIEWRAPGLSPADAPFWIMAAGLVTLMVLKRKHLRSYEPATLALASSLFLLLALRSARNFPLLLLCAVPTAGLLLQSRSPTRPALEPRRRTSPVVYGVVLIVCAVAEGLFIASAWRTPLPRLGWNPVGQQMKAAIAACDGNLYNRYDEGGYIIWFLRDRKVFIDSRQDPFPEDLVLEQLRVEETGDYVALFRRHAIACALTPEGSRLAARLRNDRWHEEPAGAGWRVYSRPTS
jgi:hypothetical protein